MAARNVDTCVWIDPGQLNPLVHAGEVPTSGIGTGMTVE
jgi:uncharacterized protein (DUF39 family)